MAVHHVWHRCVDETDDLETLPGHFLDTSRTLPVWHRCVDEPSDLEFARALAARLGGRRDFAWTEALALVEGDRALAGVNVHVEQKKVQQG